jgi:hypothetical protein
MASAGAPPAPGPDASAPLAAEGSKPTDPALALKSEDAEKLGQILVKFEALLKRPERKAITGLDLAKMEKSEAKSDLSKLSKAEVEVKLKELVKGDLKKTERNLINQYVRGHVTVDAIAPLFDKK